MAKFRIMSKDGNTVKYEGKLRYIGTYLKPSYVEFPEVSSPFPIEWEMGDYVYYPRTDMYYRLFSIPQVTKQAKKNTDIIKGYEPDGTPIYVNAYGDAFTYSNVQLHASTKELEIAPFRDLVAADNGIHFSTSPDVVTTEDVYGIARRIQACMDDLYPGRWEIRVASLGADHEVDLTETRDFALSGGTCLDALSKIYELWQDIGWIHTYENGKDVITIGYANVRKESNTTTPYLYGKGNGLTAIKKNQTNKDEFATRLYVYGSDRNLPPRFYNQLSIANAESVDIRNLMIPVDKWGRTDGLPDARKAYIENTSAVEKYGMIPKTHYFDSLESGADIYPSIEGMTASQVRSALSAMGESDYYPSNVYFGSERMDEVLFGDDVNDTGTANEEGKSYTKIIRVPFEDIYVDGVIPAESTTAVIGKHLLLNRTFEGPGKAKIEVKSEASGYVLDAGYKSVTLIVELSDSITKDKTVSQRVEIPLSKSENGDWNFTIPRSVIAKYDDEDYENFPVYFEVSVSVEMESETTEEISTEFVINSGRCDIEYTDILPKFFTMTLKQIGFNISERAANGNGKVISMKTGACAGRSFVIEACEKDSKNDGWKLTCRRQQDNTLGMWFPNINYKVSSGDRFVLLDIAMPDSYVYAAMQRLFDEGQKLLGRASKVQSHYEPSIDAKLMAESGRVLREGMYMEITDEDMVDGKTDYILIDTLNIYEDESSIPTYKVSLRERRKVTYKGTPSASSSINGSSVSDDADEKKVNLDGYATEKYVDEKYGALLDWFYQYDENTIGTKYSFFSEKQSAAGGVGVPDSGGGEAGLLLTSWPTDGGDYSSYALGGNLGVELNKRLTVVERGGGGGGAGITVDSFMSDTSQNPVENRIVKSYIDTENQKQSYFTVLSESEDVDIPGGAGGGSTTGGSPVGAVRLRVVNNVLYVESKADLSGATVKFARALKKQRNRYDQERIVKSHAWRIFNGYDTSSGRIPIAPITGDFSLERHPYGEQEEWYDAAYPYRYRVLVSLADEGMGYMDATTLLEAFSHFINGYYNIHTGHGGKMHAKVKMAVIINGVFLPFRLTLTYQENEQTWALSPI